MRSGWTKWVLSAIAAAGFSVAFSSNAQAAALDCTTGCNFTSYGGAIWDTTTIQSTGTGVIDSFVRVSSANSEIVDGHNTDGRPLLNDENSSPTFTHDLQVSDIPVVTIGGTAYYEFLLDINQTGTDPGLTLDKVQICTSSSGGLTAADTCPGSLVYNLDAGADRAVALDYNLNSGSGSGDILMYIPVSLIGTNANTFVYLYSLFGSNSTGFTDADFPGGFTNNDGFEEWAVRTPSLPPPPQVPEPTSMVLFGAGLVGVGRLVRKRLA